MSRGLAYQYQTSDIEDPKVDESNAVIIQLMRNKCHDAGRKSDHSGACLMTAGDLPDLVDFPTTLDLEECLVDISGTEDWTDSAISKVEIIFTKCSHPNWDGYGAQGLPRKAYLETKKIIRLLPNTIPEPEVSPEPDGGIGIEWFNKDGSSFLLSSKGGGKLFFAGLFDDDNEISGIENFNNFIPQTILGCLKRLYSDIYG